MRSFTSGGMAFYMLGEGERLPDVRGNRYGNLGYVIWPRGDKWDVRRMGLRGWEKIADRLFDTENEAFNFAYDTYCADEERKQRR